MFSKILVANRGEIACRIIRTARRLGIDTAVTVSEADENSLAARIADEAIPIGPPPAAESYLDIDAVVAAATQCGAEAVHPGYGFLSENAAFARALDAAGVVFVGPPADAIAVMGDKLRAKAVAIDAGVTTVPGTDDPLDDAEAAAKAAKQIGYPVMLKAAAGGGGKGMRVVTAPDDLASAFRSAQNEARSSFGDDRVFIEKFIERPRHIEIQVFADRHGNAVHLGERECSIQRRHQKVIEEAPSPFLDAATRAAMGEQAVALARAVGYHSAGTVEFIVDPNRNFYFLEMNTRLQVEHPVTELVTGLDLVELMLRVAAGEKLPIAQSDVKTKGWAIEGRVYAEDPLRDFLPSIGRLTRYGPPTQSDAIRVDDGVDEGAEITMYYDPMIAKLVGYGPDRQTAAHTLRSALDSYYIRGVNTNLGFLATLVSHPAFLAGEIHTNFIAQEYPDGYALQTPDAATRDLLLAAAAIVHAVGADRAHLYDTADGTWHVSLGDQAEHVRLHRESNIFTVSIDGRSLQLTTEWMPGQPVFRCTLDGDTHTVQVDHVGPYYRLTHGGVSIDAHVLLPRIAELLARMPQKPPPDRSRFLLSPMPGLLTLVAVEVGQGVKAGEELAVVEAMKMENILNAHRDGVVKKIHAAPGDNLAVDQAIMEFE